MSFYPFNYQLDTQFIKNPFDPFDKKIDKKNFDPENHSDIGYSDSRNFYSENHSNLGDSNSRNVGPVNSYAIGYITDHQVIESETGESEAGSRVKCALQDRKNFNQEIDSKEKIDKLVDLFKKTLHTIDEDALYTLAESIVRDAELLNPPYTQRFVKRRKGDLKTCFGYVIQDQQIFIHEKEKLGQGFVKITYSGCMVDLIKGYNKPIVHQKIKNEQSNHLIVNNAEREAKLQRVLAHPNIVTIYAHTYYEVLDLPKICIYAEKCDYNLETALRENKLDFKEKKAIILDIANALSYVHSKGYSHNDIKPDNLLVQNKHGKLSDFGLCFHNSAKNNFKGFSKIMPPEQKKEKLQTPSQKTDVYQFGLILWHSFHPSPDPKHLDDTYVYPKDLFENWPCKSDTDQKLQSLIHQCLSEKPDERPTMEEIIRQLKKIDHAQND